MKTNSPSKNRGGSAERADPHLRHLAKSLIVHEQRGGKVSGIKTPAAFTVPEKLRPHLAGLMGNGGFRALLARALALATAEIPWLRLLQVKEDGTLGGVEPLPEQLGADEFLAGRVALVAQLLGLLVAFIGEDLTLRLVREVWPTVVFSNPEIEPGVKNEKAN